MFLFFPGYVSLLQTLLREKITAMHWSTGLLDGACPADQLDRLSLDSILVHFVNFHLHRVGSTRLYIIVLFLFDSCSSPCDCLCVCPRFCT